MSDAATGRQLAMSKVGWLAIDLDAWHRLLALIRQAKSGTGSLSPPAYCLSPVASPDVAISFIVTSQVTSVTHPGLAESVLIGVRELNLGQRQGGLVSLACCRGGKPLGRSFRGGACIQ